MQTFELYNPTKILFGEHQIEKLPELLPANAKILVVYGGGSIFKNGIHTRVTEAIKDFQYLEFSGVEPNPTYETLSKAVALVKSEYITFILAVGGGSVIDGVKFISAAATFDGDAKEILRKKILFKTGSSNPVPFGAVLTLPATGSEMNSGGVVSIAETQEKLTFGGSALFPVFSICEPSVIKSLPKRQIQNGVVDAFNHVLEQYLTYNHDAILQDRTAEGILQTLIEIGPDVVEQPDNYKLASNFMWSCTFALNGQLNKGVPTDWATHMIGHELTALHGIDHARTLAIVGPNLYRSLFESKKDKLAQYGRRVWNITDGNADEIASKAIDKTVAFYHQMGMQTKLSEYTEDYANTADIIAQRFVERNWLGLGERKLVTPDLVKEIISNSI